MSIDWWANGFVGCKIDEPYVTMKKRGCHHQETSEFYCATCGKPMWMCEKALSPILDAFREGAFQYIVTTNGEKHYLGLNIVEVNKRKDEVKIDLNSIKDDKLPDIFQKLLKDLYKPENFGFWIILDAG